MDVHGPVLNPISKRIIGCALTVAGVLGTGFLERVYENALAYELQQLNSAPRAQCLNYLRATGMHLCLLMNFGTPRLEVRRIVRDL